MLSAFFKLVLLFTFVDIKNARQLIYRLHVLKNTEKNASTPVHTNSWPKADYSRNEIHPTHKQTNKTTFISCRYKMHSMNRNEFCSVSDKHECGCL